MIADRLHLMVAARDDAPDPAADRLKHAVADGDAIEAGFRSQRRYPQVSARRFGLDERRDKILGHIEQVSRDARPSDAIVFYYAGHGVLESPSDDAAVVHLMCAGVSEHDIIHTAVPVDAVVETLGRSRCATVVVLLDCCSSGQHGSRSFIGPRAAALQRTGRGFLRRSKVPEGAGRMVIEACSAGKPAFESSRLGHGLFTEALLRELRGHHRRTTVAIAELLGATRARVLETSGGRQCPTWAGRDEGLHIPSFAGRPRP